MFFSKADKNRLFEMLEKHNDKLGANAVSLGQIETQLESGDKKFEEFKADHDWIKGHAQHHKTVKWVMGLATGIPGIGGLITWWLTRRG